MKKLTVDVWSDIACPWCYVGKRRLEGALERFSHRDHVVVTWRAFELNTEATPVESSELSYVERLASKYRTTPAEAQSMIDRMTGVAADVGVEMRFDRIRPGNTFNAHRLLHLAARHDLQDTLKERFLRAYLTEGEPIGDAGSLERLAIGCGLPDRDVRNLLGSDQYEAEVREEEAMARSMGISGVPFFVFDKRYAVSGAQSEEALRTVLDKAWGDVDEVAAASSEGAACDPEGCTTGAPNAS